ncbi:MAG: hypothetical protein ACU85V_06755 [Gammaproteobacteria bacterium]
MKHVTHLIYATVLALLASATAQAASETEWFRTDNAATHLFLFADSPAPAEMAFTDLDFFRGLGGWSVESLTPGEVIASGPQVAPGTGWMRLRFDYQVPQVSFQWAEVLFDGVSHSIEGSGTIGFDSTAGFLSQYSYSSGFSLANQLAVADYFGAAAPVPLPPSALMLLTAVAFLGFNRRHAITTA